MYIYIYIYICIYIYSILLQLCFSLHRQGLRAPAAALLIVDAAQPWRPHTHALFPRKARERAATLLRLGLLLSRQERFLGAEVSLADAWREYVIASAVSRREEDM